jgi:hypothetical protein
VILLPSGTQIAINRRDLPEGSPDVETLNCRKMRDRLAFVPSSLGQPATLPLNRRAVSFWQLEPDTAFAGHTFSGFGRYALLEILGPAPKHVRLALDFTATPIRDPSTSRLPPAAVAGNGRVAFDVTGSGSARVISPPVRPTIVDGHPYVILDMGRKGRFPPVPRPGLTGLWGKSVLLDSRLLTSYVRDVSLLSDDAYRRLTPPAAIGKFPDDLANQQLVYSGIYEDGWMSGHSYFVLGPHAARALTIHADALPIANQRVELLVDGKPVGSKAVPGGAFDWTIEVPPSSRDRRRVELRWARTGPISGRDPRPATAHLSFLGFAPAP